MDGPLRRRDTLGEILEPLYGFRSLEAFKLKFSPRRVPLFMGFRDEGALPRIGVALTDAYLPGTPLSDLARASLAAYRESRAVSARMRRE